MSDGPSHTTEQNQDVAYPLHQIAQELTPFMKDLKPIIAALKWMKWMLMSLFAVGCIVVAIAIWVHNVDARAADLDKSIIGLTSDISSIASKNASSDIASQVWRANSDAITTRLMTLTEQMNIMVRDHERFIIAHGWPDANHPH